MRETYPFGVATQENGGIPLSNAQDGAMAESKHRIKLFAQDLSRVLKGEKPKFRWQFLDNGEPITAQDARPKPRLVNTLLPKSRAEQKRKSTVPPLERQIQSQQAKAELVDRLWSGKGSLASKFWPDA